MKPTHKFVAIVLLALLAAVVYGLWRSSRPVGVLRIETASGVPTQHVDQTPLLTVEKLVEMPTSAQELPFAQEAQRLADQEMDLAFAAAVRQEEEHPPELSAQAKQIQARIQKAEDALDADKARVEQLTAAESKAGSARRDALDDQLELAKAQVELDQDEIDEAKQDLARAGGDLQGRIEALRQEHEAASKVSDTMKVSVTAPVETRGLIHRYQQWAALREKQLLLQSAKHDAEEAVAERICNSQTARLESPISRNESCPMEIRIDPGA